MKLKVNLQTLIVSPFTNEDKTNSGNNGQHEQLAGYAIADIQFGGGRFYYTLLHCSTRPSTGHFDVLVEYQSGGKVRFQTYGSNTFVPDFDRKDPYYWPQGDWHLVQVAIALEAHTDFVLGSMCNDLRRSLVSGLQYL